jgi:hypothetical protein
MVVEVSILDAQVHQPTPMLSLSSNAIVLDSVNLETLLNKLEVSFFLVTGVPDLLYLLPLLKLLKIATFFWREFLDFNKMPNVTFLAMECCQHPFTRVHQQP